nr:expressed protein [Hymenolepis microstoma]CUU98090.1 hypothetical transcript [Hymenolepis microstoma]
MTTRHPGRVGWLTTLSLVLFLAVSCTFCLFREFIKHAAVAPVLNDKPTDSNSKEEEEESRWREKRNA